MVGQKECNILCRRGSTSLEPEEKNQEGGIATLYSKTFNQIPQRRLNNCGCILWAVRSGCSQFRERVEYKEWPEKVRKKRWHLIKHMPKFSSGFVEEEDENQQFSLNALTDFPMDGV